MLKRLKKLPIPIIITWIMRIILVLLLFFEIFQHNILLAASALAALLLSLSPTYFFKNFYITLPRFVESVVTLALLLHTIGLSFNLYHTKSYWWWDQMTHFLGTAVIALLAFEFIFALNYLGRIKMTARLLMVFTFCTAMTIGALWEISEFYFDKIFQTSSLGDLYDTLEDMQFNAIGGLLVAIFGYSYKYYFTKRQAEHNIKTGEVKAPKT